MQSEGGRDDFVARLSRLWARLGGVIILLMALAISFDVLTRNVLGATYLESFELGQYAFAIAVAFGLAYALVSGAHIRIDVLYRLLPRPVQVLLDLVALVSIGLLGGILTWYGYLLVQESLELGVRSATSLRVQLWIPQSIWLAGLMWFTFSAWWAVFRLILRLLGRLRGNDALLGQRSGS